MKEYRKYVNLNPVILYKEDLIDIEEILRKDTVSEKNDLNISLSYNDISYKFNSFEDLFCEKDILKINSISISVCGSSVDSNNEKHIYLDISPSSITFEIDSTNEIWYLGKIAQIKACFLKRKQWYSFITRCLFYFLIISCSCLMTIVYQITVPKRFAIYTIIYLIISIFIGCLCACHKIFRYTTILLSSKNTRKFDSNNILIVIGVLTLIATIFIPFIKK